MVSPPAAPRDSGSLGSSSRSLLIPLLWALILTGLFAMPFSAIPWPFGDVYTVFYKAYALGWHDAVVDAFARDVEYRPLFTLIVKFLYHLVGLRLWFYKALVLLQFALILGVIVWLLQPRAMRRMIAALLAISVVAALHTSRILFSFFPVNHHSLAILIVLIAAALALDRRARTLDWLLVAATFLGLFVIEFGLLIPPILTVLFLARCEGVTRRAVIGSWCAFAVYLVIRLTLGTQTGMPIAHDESGLGFADISPDQIRMLFAHAPWMFWIYNVVTSVMTVLFSEPRAGKFHFVETLLHGNTPPWLWFHVVSSTLTTAFIGWSLWRPGNLSPRDRQLAWLGLALMVFGSALGFLYTRDRIALPVGLGYAIFLYLATARALEHPPRRWLVQAVAGLSVAALCTVWLVRDVETWLILRDAAWERHLEWTDRYDELGGFTRPQTDLLERLRTAALSMTPPDPRLDPAWTYSLFEREFQRSDDPR